jgi:hypothetical protein
MALNAIGQRLNIIIDASSEISMVRLADPVLDLDDLRGTLETYGQDAQRQAWRTGHSTAPPCGDLEGLLVAGLAAFYRLRDLDARWAAVVRSGLVPFDPAAARQIEQLYNRWRDPAEHILMMIAALEKAGQTLENAAAFRAAVEECPRLDVDKTLNALAAERSGLGRQELMNELRRRVLARGA